MQALAEAERQQSPAGGLADGEPAARLRRVRGFAAHLRRSPAAWSPLLLPGAVLAAAVVLHGVTRAREMAASGHCYASYRGAPPASRSTCAS